MGGAIAMTVIEALFSYSFLQKALLSALLSGVLCGIIGVIIVEKRLVMMSGGIAHTAYGGVGLGYLAGFSPLLGAILFSLGAAFGIGALRRRGGGRTEVLISLFWSFGMAAGIVFVALAPGYPPDLNSYLFGNILTVTSGDLWLMLGVTLLVLLLFFAFYEDLKCFLFDKTFAAVSGLRVQVLDALLLGMIALAVVALLRVSGVMLAIALLTAPAATASFLTRRLLPRMLVAAGLAAGFSVAGLVVSLYANIPTGATIVAASVLVYAVAFTCRTVLARRARRRA